MISKEKFCYIIKRLENYEKLQDKVNDLFKDLIDNTEQDFCNAGGICIGHETVVIDLLCEILEPGVSERDSFISWWIYETEFGKRPDFAYVILKDGTRVDLSSADKLYDFLVENMQSSAETAEKTADKMFEELGYEETYHNFYSSELYDTTINFKTIYKELYINGNLGMQELKAINKKVEEMRVVR